MNKYQVYRQRFPLVFFWAIVFIVASFLVDRSSDTQTAQWFSACLSMLGAVFVGTAIVGTLLLEMLPLLANDDAMYLEEGQYNLAQELQAIRQEIAKIQNQNDIITKDLEDIENQITSLEDTVAG